MKIIDRFQDLADFTESEKGIIRIILEEPDYFKRATASELARAAYTSPSTVARFCQKVGCRNYREFRLRVAAEIDQRQVGGTLLDANIPFRLQDSMEDILRQVTETQVIAMKETRSLLEMERFRHAVHMLAGAECIDVYGLYSHLVYDFSYKMARIRRGVYIIADQRQQLHNAGIAYQNHCAILLSSDKDSIAERCARRLKQTGIPLLAITMAADRRIQAYADEVLYVADLERSDTKIGPFTFTTSISCLMNYLYACIFSLDYEENRRRLSPISLSFSAGPEL